MFITYDLIILCAVTFGSALIQGVAGFGSSVIAMAILPFFLSLPFVTHIVLFNSIAIGSLLLFHHRHGFRVKPIIPLFSGALFGVPIGVFVGGYLSEQLTQQLLGGAILVCSIYNLWMQSTGEQKFGLKRRWGYLFGMIAGVLGGAFNINGPPAAVYTSLTHWPKKQIIASLQAFYLWSGFAILLARSYFLDQTTSLNQAFYQWLRLVPLLFLGIALGSWYHEKIDPKSFRRIINTLLVGVSLLLIF